MEKRKNSYNRTITLLKLLSLKLTNNIIWYKSYTVKISRMVFFFIIYYNIFTEEFSKQKCILK